MLRTYLASNARLALTLGLASRPNIHASGDPAISIRDDLIEVTSTGQVDAPDPFSGSMPYTATIRIRPFVAEGSRWIYASVSPDIRVDVPWYIEVLGAIADFFASRSRTIREE